MSYLKNIIEMNVDFRGKSDKAQLAKTSAQITENLMSISRMMASQVKRSEDTIGTLGKMVL